MTTIGTEYLNRWAYMAAEHGFRFELFDGGIVLRSRSGIGGFQVSFQILWVHLTDATEPDSIVESAIAKLRQARTERGL